jgi:hypothetical protein
MARIEHDCLLISGKRFQEAMKLLKCNAAIVERIRVLAIDPQSRIDLPERGFMFAALRMNDT